MSWSASQLNGAQKLIVQLEGTLTKALKRLQAKGAVYVKTVKESPNVHARDLFTSLPEYSKLTYNYKLVGLNAFGKRVGASSSLPENAMSLHPYLVHLKSGFCSVAAKTTIVPKCSIAKAKPADILRAALIEQIRSASGQQFGWVVDRLQFLVDASATYSIQNGAIVSDAFASTGDLTPIPLADSATGSSYKITIGSNPLAFKYTETIDIKAIAKHMVLQNDYGHLYLTPWSTFWK